MALPEALGTLIARFARTGVELPGGGLNVDDVLLSREVARLFKEDAGHQHGPESYEAEIRSVVEAQAAAALGADGAELAHEMDEDYVRYCHANALLALLDCAAAGPDHARGRGSLRRSLHRARGAAVQYRPVRAASRTADPLRRPRGARPPPGHGPRRARALPRARVRRRRSWTRFAGTGGPTGPGRQWSARYYGSAIVPPLFDLLAVEERMHVRKLLLQLLIGLGEHAGPGGAAAAAATSAGTCGATRSTFSPRAARGSTPAPLEPLSGDSDPRVRLECARCLVLAGEPAGASERCARCCSDPGDGVADAAIAAAGALGVRELRPRPGGAGQKALRRRRPPPAPARRAHARAARRRARRPLRCGSC